MNAACVGPCDLSMMYYYNSLQAGMLDSVAGVRMITSLLGSVDHDNSIVS